MPDTYRLMMRGGVWYYHRRVPKSAQEALGRKVIKESLKTASKASAKRLRAALDVKWDEEIDRASRLGGHQIEAVDRDRSLPLTHSHALRIVREYIEDRERQFLAMQQNDPPTSQEEVEDMRREIEIGMGILRSPGDPRRDEIVSRTWDKLLTEHGVTFNGDQQASNAFAELIRRGLLEVDYRKLARLADDHSRRSIDPIFDVSRSDSITFGELAAEFLRLEEEEALANGVAAKSIERLRAQVALIRQLVGADQQVSSVDYDACVRVRRLMARVPANASKFYPDLHIHDAIERGAADGRETLAALTQGQYLATFRAMLDLAMRKRLIVTNPSAGMKPLRRDEVSRSEKRLPFTSPQLAAFFESAFYRACAEQGSKPWQADTTGGWRFWLPLLCLFSGLRPREALQLHCRDVAATEGGTLYLDIVDSDEGDGLAAKRLKTASSRRKVPIHPLLIRMGFLTFIDERTAATTNGTIFGGLKPNKFGDPSWYPLKRFNERYLKQEVPTLAPRQSFYSFRHNFRDALRDVGASPDVLQALGWSQGNRIVSDDYGSGLTPDQVARTMALIRYEGLDLSHLLLKGKKRKR